MKYLLTLILISLSPLQAEKKEDLNFSYTHQHQSIEKANVQFKLHQLPFEQWTKALVREKDTIIYKEQINDEYYLLTKRENIITFWTTNHKGLPTGGCHFEPTNRANQNKVQPVFANGKTPMCTIYTQYPHPSIKDKWVTRPASRWFHATASWSITPDFKGDIKLFSHRRRQKDGSVLKHEKVITLK